MAFVKLDCNILDSTLWVEREAREVFITALLMAVPMEFDHPLRQIEVDSLEFTGFEAPPDWYGYVPASGVGIVRRALVDQDAGMRALRSLGEPDNESRSHKFDGRRMIRIDGGYAILNYMDYRNKDHTSAERQRRYRERKKAKSNAVTVDSNGVTERNITQAYAEAEAYAEKQDQKKARSALVLPEWLSAETWKAWSDYRNARRGWTPKAKELSLRTLTKLHEQGCDPAEVIEQSIERSWTGLFPVGGNHENGSRNRKLSAVEQVEQAIRERRAREAAASPVAGSNGSLVDEDGEPLRAYLG
jgi:hypothetical protein